MLILLFFFFTCFSFILSHAQIAKVIDDDGLTKSIAKYKTISALL